ncbi:hypothetical protein HPB47_003524 [Ixodes persulcatus]|uniref:Uncharacterized protein n=1 Tax=Ixodes persulcatus TaxID=34615 RepID=A0AC60PJU2_IXOPE|nr:hypothetical protein HPB47_003524 [Ixodes persulcatus]
MSDGLKSPTGMSGPVRVSVNQSASETLRPSRGEHDRHVRPESLDRLGPDVTGDARTRDTGPDAAVGHWRSIHRSSRHRRFSTVDVSRTPCGSAGMMEDPVRGLFLRQRDIQT